MKKVIICYASFSGNTEEVALLVGEELEKKGCFVDYHEIGYSKPLDTVDEYDCMMIGTFTWNQGSVPDDVKDFVYDLGYKPQNVAIFGTGDTQFGGEYLYCQAVDRLVKFYDSPYLSLKVEQSPRGSQESVVRDWVKNDILNEKVIKQARMEMER